MMSAGDEAAGDKSEYRRGRPRHRVDAGEGRSPLASSFPSSFAPHLARPTGFGPLRPWFGACASVVQPFSPVCWMSPGVLAAAGAQCTAGMGVSQVDRLPVSASSGVNSALLRDILARSGVGGGGPPLDLQQSRYSVVEPSPEVQADSSQQPPEEEDEEEKEEELDSAPASPAESEKKSRLESIVSGMRPVSSSSPQPINGCKKRKLYQPVQHETLANPGDNESDAEADTNDNHVADHHRERDESPADKRRRVDHDETQKAARPLQSQLALMQQRYAQLYRDGERQAGGELDLSRGSAAPSPEKPKDEATRPIPALHKIEAEPAPASSFIDYARRVLAADPRNKENERQPGAPQRPADVQGLADVLKAEITTSLAGLIDQIVAKWAQQRRREPEPSAPYPAAQQQQQERRSPRAEILRRISQHNGRFPAMPAHPFGGAEGMPMGLSPLSGMRGPSSLTPLFPASRAGNFGNGAPVGYGSAYGLQALRDSMQQQHQQDQEDSPLSLVMTPKKKRHKVTDTRAVPRPIGSRFEDGKLADDVSSPHGCFGAPPSHLLPPSLPTSVAIPNPSLQESHFFASYPYYGRASSPERRDSASPLAPQTGHQLSLLHPSLLAAGRRSPDSLAYRLDTPDRPAGQRRDTPDRSDCNSLESGFEGQRPVAFPNRIDARSGLSLAGDQASTLTPMHLRKAKLMFFWSRYPSSSILKSFFPDINFNKNNTAQLVKWFSNFREFFYIQMEKYSRQALSEGVKTAEELTVTTDCELLRVLNLHYNRNNHIEVPTNFPFVAEAALREFFRALQASRDAEPSWKKAIYKVIARLDENVPEYFRLPSFLEQLE